MPLTKSTAKKCAAAASLGAAAYLGYRHLQHQKNPVPPVPKPFVPEPLVPAATPPFKPVDELYPASIIYRQNQTDVTIQFERVFTDETIINYKLWLLDPKTEEHKFPYKVNEKDVNLIANTETDQMEFNTDEKTYFGFRPVPIKNKWYENENFIPKGWTLKSVVHNTMTCSFIDLC